MGISRFRACLFAAHSKNRVFNFEKATSCGRRTPFYSDNGKIIKNQPQYRNESIYASKKKSNLIISSRNGHYSVIDNEQYILQAKDEKVRELCISYLSNMINLGFSKKEATDFLIEYSSKLKEPNK